MRLAFLLPRLERSQLTPCIRQVHRRRPLDRGALQPAQDSPQDRSPRQGRICRRRLYRAPRASPREGRYHHRRWQLALPRLGQAHCRARGQRIALRWRWSVGWRGGSSSRPQYQYVACGGLSGDEADLASSLSARWVPRGVARNQGDLPEDRCPGRRQGVLRLGRRVGCWSRSSLRLACVVLPLILLSTVRQDGPQRHRGPLRFVPALHVPDSDFLVCSTETCSSSPRLTISSSVASA